jgi:hypothetical protein
MANIARLSDYKKTDPDALTSDGKKNNNYFNGSGGSSGASGLSVVAPPDPNEKYGKIFSKAGRSSGGSGGSGGSGPSNGLKPVKIIFWSNGFQVGEDGPFREPNNKKDEDFLECIEKGYCPKELQDNLGNVPEIHLEDKRSEEYVKPPPPSYSAFSGGGHSMSPSGVVFERSTIFQPSSKGSGASKEPEVDASLPTCRISIRTADGKRLIGNFNTTHTVRDLQLYIDSQSTNTKAYQLLIGRPPKPIDVTNQSLEEAGLKNQSLMQKIC